MYPEKGVVIGTHSSINNDPIYMSLLLGYIQLLSDIFDPND